jgi:hypothetical protein
MNIKNLKISAFIASILLLSASCGSSDNDLDDTTGSTDIVLTELPEAFEAFDTDETDIYLSNNGTTITIETTGLPNHTTPYWSTSHPLYVAPTVTSEAMMTPTRIDSSGRDLSGTLTVSVNPQMASST